MKLYFDKIFLINYAYCQRSGILGHGNYGRGRENLFQCRILSPFLVAVVQSGGTSQWAITNPERMENGA